MKPILYIKGSTSEDVRLRKFLNFFSKNNIKVFFWGWDREKSNFKIEKIDHKYIFSGGGIFNKWLPFYYPIWMLKLFFTILFNKEIKNYNVIAINFDAALPIYLASKIKNITYIYEIYDEFAISYKFPKLLTKFLKIIDRKIMNNASFLIHVDENRITHKNCKWIVIENSPNDFFEGKERSYDNIQHIFAATGSLNSNRGTKNIVEFALDNPGIEILFIGYIGDSILKQKVLSVPNIIFSNLIPQEKLFQKLESCCAIFSLYDPTLEINRLAASNKVYDAMMMGIPVVTNRGVINAFFIENSKLGYVIDYEYNRSWNVLSNKSIIEGSKELGKNGRKLFLSKYIFDNMVKERLIPLLD